MMRDTAEGETHAAPEPDREVLEGLTHLLMSAKDAIMLSRKPESEGYVRAFLMENPHIARAFTVDARARAAADEWIEWHKTPETFLSDTLIDSMHELAAAVGRSTDELETKP